MVIINVVFAIYVVQRTMATTTFSVHQIVSKYIPVSRRLEKEQLS
jgi:hypothetical protein|tara:strand:+ start:705 stop:839 length:135 start_codon:yes stop_codon:yes gene_type:complete